MLHKFTIQTSKRDEMLDVTSRIREVVLHEGIQDGMVVVYCPHTTAGITINENAGGV